MKPLYWLFFLDVKLFTIFWILAYLLKVIPETRRASATPFGTLHKSSHAELNSEVKKSFAWSVFNPSMIICIQGLILM